ncbi:hypothetical protein H7F51_04335 [Novosphingobium flavum]|uniref:C-type lysozyme inhibitor domain-containing protein n=1 Tax=Novosphingobium flavum TaxID=1778672 RepID=A0A7X1FPR6_9SPHN|nr:hypothetical protein [Novosphingobium flavum]MBC2664744.1 hypothetical protein [Novosphingobium flavum]
MTKPAVATLLVLPLLSSACHQGESAAQQAAEDARAVAMVEAVQTAAPPPAPIELQPITAADIEKNGIYGAGCSLVPAAQPGGDPVMMANDRRAAIKLAGRFVTFAADMGSPVLAVGTRGHYVGKAQTLTIARSPGDGTSLGQDAMRWEGSVTVRDAHDQLVYSASGELTCSS